MKEQFVFEAMEGRWQGLAIWLRWLSNAPCYALTACEKSAYALTTTIIVNPGSVEGGRTDTGEKLKLFLNRVLP